jgi:hypothetical protein
MINPQVRDFRLIYSIVIRRIYGRPLEKVNIDVTIASMISGDASLLCIPRPVSPKFKLPSWVTDWTAFFDSIWPDFNASDGSAPRYKVSCRKADSKDFLILEGVNYAQSPWLV